MLFVNSLFDVVVEVFGDEQAYYVAADESSTACDEYVTLHVVSDC